jgi:hypothetical protein
MIGTRQLKAVILEFTKANAVKGMSHIDDRRQWYQKKFKDIRPLLKPAALAQLSKPEAMRLYKQMSVGGPRLHLKTFLANGLPRIRAALSNLLYGSEPLAERFYNFTGSSQSKYRLHGVNKAFASTALHLIRPDEYAVWNRASEGGLAMLGIVVERQPGTDSGQRYLNITQGMKKLQANCGFHDLQIADGFVQLIYRRVIGAELLIVTEDDELAFPEGKQAYRTHLKRERKLAVTRRAKKQRLAQDPFLRCDVCGFSFAERYGDKYGQGFIEAHHTLPLSQAKSEVMTRVEDIALVCSNCHRMLHRLRPWLSMGELKNLLVS